MLLVCTCQLLSLWVKEARSVLFKRMASTHNTKLPPWNKPEGTPLEKLKLYNSLTKKNEEFIPLDGKRVLWYSCGPTVYDASHMGHARSYITFDILRRVLSDYFKYDVLYVMNITDVDDKIIRRARRSHLLSNYLQQNLPLNHTMKDVQESLELFKSKVEREGDSDKKAMLSTTLLSTESCLGLCEKGTGTQSELLSAAQDPLSDWLDSKHGSNVTDHRIFSRLTRHWEEEFHRDMTALNVLPPDVLTRVSEYVPEVIAYVQKIMDNGYAYESNGSVYFNVAKFSSSPDHHYAKLVPEAVGDLQALVEGEGELSSSDERIKEKKSRNDFALWKSSKRGEPSWSSPWGEGRPGWHIECSVMACEILGGQSDIHTGGVDLKFPHHDNEIAQAEACYGHDHWMSYFLHSGHLTIEGCKMSKSLKNFITIKESLSRYTARQLRLAFLLHSWGATLDYSEQTMREALHWEKLFKEFFLTVKDCVRRLPSKDGVESYSKFTDKELELSKKLMDSKTAVHTALCDSIDTPVVLRALREIVTSANIYMSSQAPNVRLLVSIATYITDIFKVFGVIPGDTGIGFPISDQSDDSSKESFVVPFISLLADFRETVRKNALEKKNISLLESCDHVRDVSLPELGVVLEDKDGHTALKIVGKEAAIRERLAVREAQAEKERLRDEQKRKMETAKAARDAAAAVSPYDMFRHMTSLYSEFDEQGLPTHDVNGQKISDSQRKKLRKQWQTQEKKNKEFLSRK